MAIYDKNGNLEEQYIYGVGRLGMLKPSTTLRKEDLRFEITDHLGSVRAVISGARTAANTVGITYLSDYYSNGVNSREFRSSEGQPRYMFQGMEWDIETKTYNTLYRFYSPEYGRWWSPDPIVQPWQSTYSAMDGNPVFFTDPLGLKARKNAEPPTIKGTDGQEAYGTKGPIRDESEIKFQYSEKDKGWIEIYPDAVSVAPKNNFQLTKTIAFTNVSNSVRSPRIVANSSRGYDIDKAVNYLNENVIYKNPDGTTYWGGKCSPFVPNAINAGFGFDKIPTDQAGGKYGPILKAAGFQKLNINLDEFNPKKGDIAVMDGYPGGKSNKQGIPYGHIQMYNGNFWRSDFHQTRPFWPGAKYETYKPALQIYRWGGVNQ